MAPPASLSTTAGSLAVQVTDQAGAAVADMPVTVTPGPFTQNTNSVGCAFFGALAVGNVTAVYAQTGWVDAGGNSNVTLNGSVTAGATTTISANYAQAAQIAASFDTKVGGAAPVSAKSSSVSIANPGLPSPQLRSFTTASPQPTITATNVYPFTSGYGVFAGSCAANNPTTYNPNYFTSHPGSYATPGPGGSSAITVREPALNVKVTRSGSALAGAHVIVTATGAGCTDKFTMTTDSAGLIVFTTAPTAPAVPFGTYSVCADYLNRKATAPAVSNTDPNGNQSAVQTPIAVPTAGGAGVCS
jgi:hypothetical protein